MLPKVVRSLRETFSMQYRPSTLSPSPVLNPSGYPLEALGPIIGAAVREHHINTGVALELVAACAMATTHTFVQDLFDIERRGLPPSPLSAYHLILADSGEGKDTAAGPFLKVIRDHERERRLQMDADRHHASAELAAWKAEGRSLEKQFERAAGDTEVVSDLKELYVAHAARRPAPFRESKIIHDNITSGALENSISEGSKSVLIATTEAGGLMKGQLFKAAYFLNLAFDATPTPKDRVGESRILDDYRVSGMFAVQRAIFDGWFTRNGADAHGSGLTARLLVTVSHTTLGNRFLSPDQVLTFEAIDRHGSLGKEMLRQSEVRRALSQPRHSIRFSDPAARLFQDIYNYIQSHMAQGRPLRDISGQAAKSAEHIARFAGVFHAFEGREGHLDVEILERARQVGFWHLDQFFSMFAPGQAGDPRERDVNDVADAVRSAAARGLHVLTRKELRAWCRLDLSAHRFSTALHLLLDRGLVEIGRLGRATVIRGTWMLFNPPYRLN